MRAILFQMVLDFLFYLKDKEWKRDRDLILSFPPQIINIQGGAKPKWSTENSVWISPKMAGTHLLAPSLAASQGAHQKENVVRIRNRTQSINMLMWHTSISGGMLCIVPNISVLDPFFFPYQLAMENLHCILWNLISKLTMISGTLQASSEACVRANIPPTPWIIPKV